MTEHHAHTLEGVHVPDLLNFDTIGESYGLNAARHSDKVAFIADGQRMTFDELNKRANQLSTALDGAGLRRGDRVVILSRNRPEHFEVFGIVKSGLIPVPLNWRLTKDEIRATLQDCQPAAVIGEEDLCDSLDGFRLEGGARPLRLTFGPGPDSFDSYADFVDAGVDVEPAVIVSPDDIACLVYTSGTTGAPRGVQHTHRALLDNARVLVRETGYLRPGDVVLAVMPLFHVGGMWYYAFPAFALGCTTVVLPAFEPTDVLRAIAEHHITAAHLVPTMLAAILSCDGVAAATRTLRLVFYAGSSIPLEVLQSALTTFSSCDFVQGYGSTEAAAISYLGAVDHRRASADPGHASLLSSCGRAFEATEIRIDGLEGGNGLGEIVVRSPNIMHGYWGNGEATAEAIEEGWLHTGDVGRFDAQGYLYLVDRKKDMIVTGGENVFPSEVEAALRRHPAVADAAVFAVPDPHWVERVVAAVVPSDAGSASVERILQDVRGWLAGYKCPKEIFFVERLPVAATGKVLRKELRRQFGSK